MPTSSYWAWPHFLPLVLETGLSLSEVYSALSRAEVAKGSGKPRYTGEWKTRQRVTRSGGHHVQHGLAPSQKVWEERKTRVLRWKEQGPGRPEFQSLLSLKQMALGENTKSLSASVPLFLNRRTVPSSTGCSVDEMTHLTEARVWGLTLSRHLINYSAHLVGKFLVNTYYVPVIVLDQEMAKCGL